VVRGTPDGRRWWRQTTSIGELTVVTGPRGVVRIDLPARGVEEPDAEPAVDEAVAAELDEWFAGTRRTFDVTADLDGAGIAPGFRRTVLETVRDQVPFGETVTYGELAILAGRPGAARAVGTAMARNPIPLLLPCHRVVASNGIGGYGGGREGIEMKRTLLALEGHDRW
jgi:methylated-DNA-[protein]-cysteine S-methyltransferase